jgi:hypothetical protein
MKRILALSLLVLSCVCFAESTNVDISSSNPMKIYKITNIGNDERMSLFPSNEYSPSDLQFVGITPLQLRLENGVYLYTVGGNERFSKSFRLMANGNDIRVSIKGNLERATKDSFWALGLGIGCVLSLSTVKLINDQMPVNKNFVGFLLPIATGCGFGYSLGRWIYDLPRVEVK